MLQVMGLKGYRLWATGQLDSTCRAPPLHSGRLLYNLQSAVSLHFLLAHFTPLASPVVMVLPIPPAWHVALSAGCLGRGSSDNRSVTTVL
jgi:hypothetical protein